MAQAVIFDYEPVELRAGDTWSWNRYVTDYTPAAGWTLTYSFIGPTVLHLTSAEITAQSSYWQVRVPMAATEKLKPGRYAWYAFVSDADERYQVGEGSFVVLENVQAIGDGRISFARQQLEIVERALTGRLTADIESYSINGRAVSKIPFRELLALRVLLITEIAGEENIGGAERDSEIAFVPA